MTKTPDQMDAREIAEIMDPHLWSSWALREKGFDSTREASLAAAKRVVEAFGGLPADQQRYQQSDARITSSAFLKLVSDNLAAYNPLTYKNGDIAFRALEVHRLYVDLSPEQLKELGVTREQVLHYARELSDSVVSLVSA
jgi:hypothetical protein